ncbi:hypothetical protein GQ53DRAFT_592027, partial [Thozetella sp. PMI_491]
VPLPEGSIRLLRLLPHSDKHSYVECQLITCSLLDSASSHPFEALSYRWGSENDQKPICIDGYELSVNGNLHAALSHLQDRFIERIIWIDAICINQNDRVEKGHQVQSMARIYAKASRVIVWLGEAMGDGDQALEMIRKAAEERYTESSTNRLNQQSILTLLKREWFQRIWVLQEVAAARNIRIKCGSTEIDGYAFCLGLSVLNLFYQKSSDLMISPIAYLIRGAPFRPQYESSKINRLNRFSLNLHPLVELVNMYHTYKATDPRDKVYALLGMSSDDPSTTGLLANYETPWKEVFRKLINFCLSNQVSVDTWDDKEVAVIQGKGCVLGRVDSVKRDTTRDDGQSIGITWKNTPSDFGPKKKRTSYFTFPALASQVQVGDAVCLLRGASNPIIVRPCNDFSTVAMISVPQTENLQQQWASTTAFPTHFLLLWDLNPSLDNWQDRAVYKSFMSSRQVPIESKFYLGDATRLWGFGIFLKEMGRHKEAYKVLRNSMEYLEVGLKSTSERLHERELGEITDLLIEDKGGFAPLSWAAEDGHEAIVQLLLDKGAAKFDANNGSNQVPLWWAAESGREAIVQLLLGKGVDIEGKVDSFGQTPLSLAAKNGHEAIVQLLLDKGADIEGKMDYLGQTPLWLAAKNG